MSIQNADRFIIVIILAEIRHTRGNTCRRPPKRCHINRSCEFHIVIPIFFSGNCSGLKSLLKKKTYFEGHKASLSIRLYCGETRNIPNKSKSRTRKIRASFPYKLISQCLSASWRVKPIISVPGWSAVMIDASSSDPEMPDLNNSVTIRC